MRGKLPRAHGGWSRAQVWCPFCSRCSPAIGRPSSGGGGLSAPHPSSRRPPRLCLRESEWRSAQLHSAAQISTGWLTDWRCCAPWMRHSDWVRRHPPAGSQSLLPIPIHDHPNWGTGAGNGHLGRDDVFRAMLWNEECRSANFSPPPLLYRRLLPSGVWSSRTDTFSVHHLSLSDCCAMAPLIRSLILSIKGSSVYLCLTHLSLTGQTREKRGYVKLLKQKSRY